MKRLNVTSEVAETRRIWDASKRFDAAMETVLLIAVSILALFMGTFLSLYMWEDVMNVKEEHMDAELSEEELSMVVGGGNGASHGQKCNSGKGKGKGRDDSGTCDHIL